MHATNVRNLKKNPSLALRQAEESPVLVLKGNEPNALIVHLGKAIMEGNPSVRPALAASLFKGGTLSLGASVRTSGMSMSAFVSFLAELGIDVVRADEATDQEVKELNKWLAS